MKEEKVETGQYYLYRCEKCGVDFISSNYQSECTCIYCENIITNSRLLKEKYSPEYVIPFRKKKEDAIEEIKKLIKNKPLISSKFSNPRNLEKFRGVFVPVCLYDVKAVGNIVASCKLKEKWTTNNTSYVKSDKYKVVRGGTIVFNNLPIDGSTRFDNKIMNGIEPYNFNELVPFKDSYIRGYYVEKFDDNVMNLFDEASQRVKSTAIDTFMDSITEYDEKELESESITPKEEKRKFAILPVWMLNVKINNKIHTIAVNGQTGEIYGDFSIDNLKATLIGTIIFAIVAAIVYLIAYKIYIGG